MLRLYREMVERMLLLVMYAKRKGISPYDAFRYYLQTDDAKRSGVTTAFKHTLNHGIETNEEWDELISQVEGQLKGVGTVNDGSIVDTMIELLQLPYARNIISGKTFTTLRKALLLPEEMAAFQTAVRNREISCVGCGFPLQNAELVSLRRDNQDVSILCFRCQIPTLVGCPQCADPVGIDNKIIKALQKRAGCGCNGTGVRPEGANWGDDLVGRAQPRPILNNAAVRATAAGEIFTANTTNVGAVPHPPHPAAIRDEDRGLAPDHIQIREEARAVARERHLTQRETILMVEQADRNYGRMLQEARAVARNRRVVRPRDMGQRIDARWIAEDEPFDINNGFPVAGAPIVPPVEEP